MVFSGLHEIYATIGSELGIMAAGAVGGTAIYCLSKFKQWWKDRKEAKTHALPELLGKDVGVYKLLAELLIKLDSGRVNIFQFHNGTYYVNSTSQMKFSCTHELVSDGVSRMADFRRNMLTSQYAETMHEIISRPSYSIDIPKAEDNDFNMMAKVAGGNFLAFSVMKHGDVVEGFLSITFLDTLEEIKAKHYPNNTIEEVECIIKRALEPYAQRIGYILRK